MRTNFTSLDSGNALEKDSLLCLEKPVTPVVVPLGGAETVMAHSLSGALGGTRTPNLLIRSQMLYPIEPRALNLICKNLTLAKVNGNNPLRQIVINLITVRIDLYEQAA